MKRVVFASIVIASLAVARTAHAADVSIRDNVFDPDRVTIDEGASVTWTHRGAAVHTVTADDGSFDSGNLAAGQTFTHRFSDGGTFRYHCEVHPSMTGTVVVRGEAVPPPDDGGNAEEGSSTGSLARTGTTLGAGVLGMIALAAGVILGRIGRRTRRGANVG